MDRKKQKRHTCIMCKKKTFASKMVKVRQHWLCVTCSLPGESPGNDRGVSAERAQDVPEDIISASAEVILGAGTKKLQVLNLYCGIGGNRKFWKNCDVTAVEYNAKIAAAYKKLYPNDTVIVGDAHEYLLKNFFRFDFIWGSHPCQSFSRMNYWLPVDKKRYPDLRMYSEIILLQNFFKGLFVYENVDSYFTPLIPPTIKISRHLFWSNFPINNFQAPELFKDRGIDLMSLSTTQDKDLVMDWLGIHHKENLYLSGKNYLQVFRNCVHPDIGRNIFKDMIAHLNGLATIV